MANGNSDQEVQDMARAIVSRTVTLVSLIEKLGPDLTNIDTEVRRAALDKLSAVICHLPCDFLNDEEITCLLDFFSARFLDHHSLIPYCLAAMKTLSTQNNLTKEGALSIADVLLNNQNFQVQSLRQPERLLVFQTLTNLFSFHELGAACKDSAVSNNHLLFGFIQTIDGEKDPRNLLLVFDLAVTVSTTFDLSQLGDELFDVIACYFPIDFTPPKGKDTSGKFEISADDLRSRMRKFLSSNARFYSQTLPLIIEKMSSSLTASRLEAAEALRECANNYPASCFRSFLLPLWDSLQAEIFGPIPAQSNHLVIFSSCLSALAKKLSDDAAVYEEFYKIASTQLNRFISEPSLRFARQSAKVISALLLGVQCNTTIFVSTMGHFLKQYNTLLSQQSEKRNRALLVESIGIILDTEADSSTALKIEDAVAEELLGLLLSCASTSALVDGDRMAAEAALKAISSMAKFSQISDLRHRALDVIIHLCLTPSCNCKAQCVSTVYFLVKRLKPDALSGCALLDKALPDVEANCLKNAQKHSDSSYFDLIVAICQSEPVSAHFADKCSKWYAQSMLLDDSALSACCSALLAICYRSQLKQGSSAFVALHGMLQDVLKSRRLAIESVRELIALAVSHDSLLQMYSNNTIYPSDVVNILALGPSHVEESERHNLYSRISMTVLEEMSSIEPSVEFCYNLCAFLTKCFSVSALEAFYNENRGIISKSNRALVIVGCALFVRGSSHWTKAIDSIIDLLSHEDAVKDSSLVISKLFSRLFSDEAFSDGKGFSPRCLANVSPLRKQAIVCRMSPVLAENVRTRRVNIIANLTILTDLIKLGKGACRSLLEPVWPSVVDQLEHFPLDRLSQVIDLLRENVKSVLDSAEAFRLVDVMLRSVVKTLSYAQPSDTAMGVDKNNANDDQANGHAQNVSYPMQVRLVSVNLLLELANYLPDYSMLLGPAQKRIVRALKPCLSDHKRLVRSAAANAINRWSCS